MIKTKTIAILLILFNTLLVVGQTVQGPTMVHYFTDNGFSAAVKVLQHPAGEHYKGVTYVAYQGPLEDPYVASYDHGKDMWSGPFKAGESILGKTPGTKIDNHGKPAMIIDDTGYIHLVFGGHGGLTSHGTNPLGDVHNGQMIHVVTKNPLDISSWEVLDNIPPFGTYNQLIKMDNGDIYLFYRHGAHRSNWVYQRSTDDGRSFESPVSILKTKLDTEAGINDAWYAWFTNGNGNEIIAAYNYHLCREDSAAHIGQRHNGYYMVMNTDDHVWRNVKRERLSMPLTKEHADKMTLVVNTGDKWTVQGTAAIDQEGHPNVTFTIGEHMGLRHGGPKQVNHYRWTGQKWYGSDSTDLPVAVGDMLVSSPNEVSLLLAYKEEGIGEIAWWNSTDGGQSFVKGDVLIKNKNTGFNITSMIRNAHPDARVIIAGQYHEGDFRYMHLVGDNGPIKRLKAEADQIR